MVDTNVDVKVEVPEVKADTVKRIQFTCAGLMEGISMEGLSEAVKVLEGNHDVQLDGDTYRKYVDAIAVIRNAEVIIKRTKEIEKKLHIQIERGTVKNSKLVGDKWVLQAIYSNEVKLQDLGEKSNADAIREIVTVAAKFGQVAGVTSSITLKSFADTVDAEVVEVAAKYGYTVVEGCPQIKQPAEIKVKK